MIPGKSLENLEGLLPLGLFNNNISLQDNNLLLSNQYLPTNIITKTQKDFIIENNKEFYNKFKNAYLQNKDLKDKLNKLLEEKKGLKKNIINLDKKFKKINLSNNNENINTSFTQKAKSALYRKRIRRKKIEINNKYECTFPGCNKGYLSKCSLNMHIKLKHQINIQNDVNL